MNILGLISQLIGIKTLRLTGMIIFFYLNDINFIDDNIIRKYTEGPAL